MEGKNNKTGTTVVNQGAQENHESYVRMLLGKGVRELLPR